VLSRKKVTWHLHLPEAVRKAALRGISREIDSLRSGVIRCIRSVCLRTTKEMGIYFA
jgi:hypothetical protein